MQSPAGGLCWCRGALLGELCGLPVILTSSLRHSFWWAGCMPALMICRLLQVQELMAAQLAFALFGWLDAPASSLFQVRHAS